MSSPFTLFRRHQRAMLAVIGILCMIGFSIGGVGLMDNMSDQPGGANPIVATAYGETLRRGDVEQLISRHITAIRFLAGCDAAQYNLASDSQFSEMLAQRVEGELGPATERNVVAVWLKSERARRMGMVISDDAINAYLRQRTGDRVTRATFSDIARQMRTGQPRIFEALRMELLAMQLEEIALRAFQTTPAQRFDYYRRLNQRASVEVVPVRVEDFTDQVNDPPDEELESFFEEHKDQEPQPDSPDPGFKQPKKAAFEVVVAKYEDFNDPTAVTEEQVKEHYEKFKDQRYLFSYFDFPPSDEDQPTEDKPGDDKSKRADEGTADGDQSDAQQGQKADEKKPDETKNEASSDNDADAADAEEDGKSSADDEQSSLGADATGLAAIKTFGAALALLAADEPSVPMDASFIQANIVRVNGRLASEVADASSAEDARDEDKDDGDADGDKTAASDAADETFAEKNPANGKPSDTADEATSNQADSNQRPSSAGETAGDADQSDPSNADQPDAKGKKRTPSVAPQITDELMLHRDIREGEKPKYAPLWRVERTIRRELAAQQATEKMEAALKAVQSKMYRYKQQRGADDTGIERPDLEKLAQQSSLSVVETGLLTAHELERKYPDLAEAHGERGGITFINIGYSNRAKFDFSTMTDDAGNRYLFWKTEEEQARVPEFAEIRSQVLRTWKMNKARDLAVERAQELVEKAKQSAKPLKDAFADQAKFPVSEAGPFSWLTAGGISMRGRMPPRLSEVEGVEQPGPEFMKEVFTLPVGGVGQAWNRPQTINYVVRVEKLETSPDVLRAKFATEPYSSYFIVASVDGNQFRERWLKGIETEAGLTWHEPRTAREDNSEE